METVRNFIFLGSKITADGDHSHEIKRCLLLGRKAMTNLDSILKNRDKGLCRQSYGFSMYGWELDYKESWEPKNWYFQTLVLEKTLESPLDCKETQPVYPKGDLSSVFIGRTDAKAETPILCPPNWKNWLIGKDPDARKDWRQGEKGMTEDEMVGWHHRLDGHEFEQARVWVMDREAWGAAVHGVANRHDWATELNWSRSSVPPLGRTTSPTPSLYVVESSQE